MKQLPVIFAIILGCSFAVASVAQDAKPVEGNPPTANNAAATAKGADKSNAARQTKAATRADRLDLDTTVVTGNRELPRVLYIVPWKKAEIGDMPAQPFNTLLDEVLAPVDRDVFKREVKYFHTVTQSDTVTAPITGAAKEASDAAR